MTVTTLKSRFGFSLSISVLALAAANAAMAQEVAPEVPDDDAIIVTGTRLIRPQDESQIPVTAVSIEDITRSGQISVGDVLNDLPSLRSTFSQSNSTQYIGTAGLNLLDLRPRRCAHARPRQRPASHHGAGGRVSDRRQHDPDRTARAGRYRHRRQFGGLWIRRHGRGRELRAEARL